MMAKLRVGIIGTGFGARVHAPIMNAHDNFEVVSIASVSRGQLENVKQDTGIEKVYSDWKEMLEKETLDVLAIASAPYLHHEMVLEGFKHGLHILCEKPMAFDASQSFDMIEAQKRSGKKGFLNFEFRFLPARRKVKEILERGSLGKIMHINYTCTSPGYVSSVTNKRGWLGQTEYAGGMLGAIGSHMTDSLQWWFGDTISEISGQLETHIPEWSNGEGDSEIRTADDAFHAIGKFSNGMALHYGLFYSARHAHNSWKLEIFGTEGTLVMTDDAKVELALGDGEFNELALDDKLEIPEGMSAVAARYYDAFYPMLTALYESIAEDKQDGMIADFEDGHNVQLVLDAIRRSSAEGVRVSISK